MGIELESLSGGPWGHLRHPRVAVIGGGWDRSARERVLPAALARLGIPGVETARDVVFPKGGMEFRWPRDLSWTDFPIVDGPFYKPSAGSCLMATAPGGMPFLVDLTPKGDGEAMRDRLSRLEHVLVAGDSDENVRDQVWSASKLLRFAGVRCPISAHSVSRDKGPSIDASGPEAAFVPVPDSAKLREEAEAGEGLRDRFLWCWRVNASAILGKAVDLALGGEADAGRDGGRPLFGHRWTLLFFWAIARRGGQGEAHRWHRLHGRTPPGDECPLSLDSMRARHEREGERRRNMLRAASGLPGFARDRDGALRFEWKGSGAHPAFVEREDAVSGTNALLRWAWHAVEPLGDKGLIGYDEVGVLRLTAAGIRLREALHPALDDPDLPLRWHDPRTGSLRPECAGAVDDWMKHTFRRAKARVNKLARP